MVVSQWSFSIYYLNFAVNRNRSVKDAVHAENTRLWRVDDWSSKEGAKHAAVGDSEGAALHILNGELASAGDAGQSCEFAFDLR